MSKFIQITATAATSEPHSNASSPYALDDDGHVWRYLDEERTWEILGRDKKEE